MKKDQKIFIALAAYCEPELRLTIEDCIRKAQFSGRLRFGICMQYDNNEVPEAREDCIDDLLDKPQFKIMKFEHRESKGGCWARNLAQSQYDGEDYTLEVDAHSRFIQNWDTILIKMMHDLPSDKPLISTFPTLYFRENGQDKLLDSDDLSKVQTTLVEHWSGEGWVNHPKKYIPENSKFPRRTRILSGAFVFTYGIWNVEVMQDPEHYYTGEEFALTLRSFTSGYDLFDPSQIVVWHRCHPKPNRKHFSDYEREHAGNPYHAHAVQRLQILLKGDPNGELGRYTLGKERTLEDYYIFSGLNCENMTIHPDAKIGGPTRSSYR